MSFVDSEIKAIDEKVVTLREQIRVIDEQRSAIVRSIDMLETLKKFMRLIEVDTASRERTKTLISNLEREIAASGL